MKQATFVHRMILTEAAAKKIAEDSVMNIK